MTHPPENYPDFFVIGAAKCGTTTLYGVLRQHPDIVLPDQKETHFFYFNGEAPAYTDSGAQGLNQNAFTDRAAYEALYAGKSGTKGEICPSYLMGAQTAVQIHAIRPDAKIIAVLRDPVERTFSAYRHMKARGSEMGNFDEALAAEADHIARNWQPMSHYTRGSLYSVLLQPFYDCFPASQIMVIEFERLKDNPMQIAQEVVAFLGLPPMPLSADLAQTNKTVVLKSGFLGKLLVQRPPWVRRLRKLLPKKSRARMKEWVTARLASEDERMSPQTRRRLEAFFAEDARKTRALTGASFKTWSI